MGYRCKCMVHNVQSLLSEANNFFVKKCHENQQQADGLELHDRVLCGNINMLNTTSGVFQHMSGILLDKTLNDIKLTCTVKYDYGKFSHFNFDEKGEKESKSTNQATCVVHFE